MSQLTDAIAATGTPERRGLGEAAAALALPLAETLVTPQTIVDLLDDGWPQGVDPLPQGHTGPPRAGLRLDGVERLAGLYWNAQMRGFATIVVPVPPDAPSADQFQIRMRLRNWSWRLVEIRLNGAVRARLAEALTRTMRGGKSGGESGGSKSDGDPSLAADR